MLVQVYLGSSRVDFALAEHRHFPHTKHPTVSVSVPEQLST